MRRGGAQVWWIEIHLSCGGLIFHLAVCRHERQRLEERPRFCAVTYWYGRRKHVAKPLICWPKRDRRRRRSMQMLINAGEESPGKNMCIIYWHQREMESWLYIWKIESYDYSGVMFKLKNNNKSSTQRKEAYLATYHRRWSSRDDSSDLLFWSSQTDNKPGGHVSACNNMVQRQDQRQWEMPCVYGPWIKQAMHCLTNDLLVNIKVDTVSLRCK